MKRQRRFFNLILKNEKHFKVSMEYLLQLFQFHSRHTVNIDSSYKVFKNRKLKEIDNVKLGELDTINLALLEREEVYSEKEVTDDETDTESEPSST